MQRVVQVYRNWTYCLESLNIVSYPIFFTTNLWRTFLIFLPSRKIWVKVKAVFHRFIWSILEYLDPYDPKFILLLNYKFTFGVDVLTAGYLYRAKNPHFDVLNIVRIKCSWKCSQPNRTIYNFPNTNLKGATKSYRKIIFVSAAKIGEGITNILNCYFSSKIHILAHQTKYIHIGN